MLETTMTIPRCDNGHKVHAWLADRMGAHRKQGVEYLHVALSAGGETLLSVVHDKPIAEIKGSTDLKLPDAGAVVRFRARINPTRKINGKRQPVGVSEISAWLQRQIKGATIQSCDVLHTGYDEFHKKRNNYWFYRADVEGELRVDSLEEFKQTIMNGVGRMKAFGYGLIAVEGMMAFKVLGI